MRMPVLLSCLALAACITPDGTKDVAARDAVTRDAATDDAVTGDALTQAPYSQEDEAEHLARFKALVESFSTGVGLVTYDPMVAVKGANEASLLTVAEQTTISSKALANAREAALDDNTTALIVWRKGAIEAEYYFGDNTAKTLLNSRSFAKPLTAIAIGRALELGAIQSLDQPVADFIPAWRTDAQKAQILVRHLLDMRTGFLPQAAVFDPQNILNRAYLHPRHDEVIINDYPLVSEPGSRYDYSNATSEMIAPVIEAATGQQYEEFLSSQVLSPIGAAGGEIWVNRNGGMAHSGCCILLPARDWLRLSVLLLNDGEWEGRRLLPEGFVTAMRTPTAENRYYGMGLWVAGDYTAERGIANPDRGEYTTLHSEPYQAADLFLWDGNGNQVSYIVPSEDLVILRMGKSPPKPERWDNARLPNLIIQGITANKGSSEPQASSQ